MDLLKREKTIQKYQYLIGKQINNWTVLDIVYDREKPDAICQCGCENKTIKPVNLRSLLNGASKNCGCGRKQMLRDTRTKDITGQRFGKLVVIKILPDSSQDHRRQYLCHCDCGNDCIVKSTYLLTGETHSCGCLNSYYNSYISQFLRDIGEKFRPEYYVKINGNTFKYDFYLPKYNLFIEYDGEHHFKPMRYHKDEKRDLEELFKRQKNDKIKNDYCLKNNINLLRIPYYEKENIDSIIINCLQRLNDGESIFITTMQQSELQL